MSDTAVQKRRLSSSALWILGGIFVAVFFFFAYNSIRVLQDAGSHELHAADVIIVFGAAEYAGRPSPVFRARLDHAYELYRKQLAPVIITTGGAGDDPNFTEGGVGHDYLMRRGIPDAALIAETLGSDTAQSAERIGSILRTNRMSSCIAVSDAYHVFRIRKLLEKEGVKVYVAPRPDSRPKSLWQRFIGVQRETASYLLWKLHVTT